MVESEPGLPELDEKTRVLTFFAVRELLLAVLRPEGAGREPRVLVARAGNDLEVTVTDQGQGFDGARVGSSGLDLKEVGELLEHAGGSLELRPAPDGGASVRLRLPLAASSARVA